MPDAISSIAVTGTVSSSLIADIPGLESGTYTSVTVDKNGLVVAGSNPQTINASETTSSTWTVGKDSENENFITIFADVGVTVLAVLNAMRCLHVRK